MSAITLGNVTIDRDRFEVWVDMRRVDLTFVEFELLFHLAKNEGKVLARSRLMHAIWNEPSRGQDRKLTVHMSRLRKRRVAAAPGILGKLFLLNCETKVHSALLSGAAIPATEQYWLNRRTLTRTSILRARSGQLAFRLRSDLQYC
jgi:Transcriptional regulatory protein, C terminal